MNKSQALKFMYKLRGKKYNLELGAIKRLLSKLGNPHLKLKVIHVAGTNGKGSVCAMVSSILSEYKVGMYTSPHLVSFNERIQINSKSISNKDFLKYFNKVVKVYSGETFFEFVTALAFLYFHDKKVDYLVLEVGMGGRLDATNVINPLISVITNIGLEHQQYLGNDIGKIAYEKAGIIKEKGIVVTSAKGVALDVIKKIANQRGNKLFIVKDKKNIKLNVLGSFQKENALIAIKVASILKISKKNISKGLLEIKWPGRFEYISKNVLVDCAHNLAGINVLKKELSRIKKEYKKIILVFGVMADKEYGKMLDELLSLVDFIVLTKPKIKRALDPKKLVVKKDKKIIKDVSKALGYAKKVANGDDLVLVTGSIYTVGEVLGRPR